MCLMMWKFCMGWKIECGGLACAYGCGGFACSGKTNCGLQLFKNRGFRFNYPKKYINVESLHVSDREWKVDRLDALDDVECLHIDKNGIAYLINIELSNKIHQQKTIHKISTYFSQKSTKDSHHTSMKSVSYTA